VKRLRYFCGLFFHLVIISYYRRVAYRDGLARVRKEALVA
jgi:hypothetical protein